MYAEIQQRRRERDAQAKKDAAGPKPAAELTPEEKLADRYGKRR
jgi:hypothetical protein